MVYNYSSVFTIHHPIASVSLPDKEKSILSNVPNSVANHDNSIHDCVLSNGKVFKANKQHGASDSTRPYGFRDYIRLQEPAYSTIESGLN